MTPRAARAAWLLAFLCVAAALHLLQPVPLDADTAYHFVAGQDLWVRGHGDTFPWTRFSWLGQHYADGELLFHAIFGGLAPLGYVPASRLLGVAALVALLCALQAALRRVGGLPASVAGVVALGVFALSGYATLRLALVRPYLLALLLLLAAWDSARRRAPWRIAAVGVAYPLAYLGWPAGVGVVLVTALAEAWARRERPWVAGVAWMGLGNALGVALHPRPRALLEHAWVENGETLLGVAPVAGVGEEFARFSPGEFLRAGIVPLLAAGVAATLAWRARRSEGIPPDARAGAVSAAALAVCFGLLTLHAQRFVELLVPFTVLAVGLAWRPSLRHALGALVAVAALAWGLDGGRSLAVLRDRRDVVPPPVAARLAARVPVGAPVFTCSWGATGELLRAMPERRAMVALNPTHFARIDPMGYRLWVAATHAAPPAPVRLVRERFGSDYAVCERTTDTAAFRAALAQDPDLRSREVIGGWEVFDVRPGPVIAVEGGP